LDNPHRQLRTNADDIFFTTRIWIKHGWLVVLTILKNISQWEGLSHNKYYGKLNMFQTTNQMIKPTIN
jgi:hypothetical protein